MGSQAKRMLIIEDDPDVGFSMEAVFGMEGFDVDRALDGVAGLEKMMTLPPFDVVLLDINLPLKGGFEILREARQRGVDSPVIIVSARGREEDRLKGFALGADDYMAKPFNFDELALRVRAVLRRSAAPQETQDHIVRIGNVVVDLDSHAAWHGHRSIAFTALEFSILRYFVQHRGRTVSRRQLLRDVWGMSDEVATRTIDRHVASLRKKIEVDPAEPRLIETVYGVGYKFLG